MYPAVLRLLRKMKWQIGRERLRRELDEELAAHASLKVSNYTAAGLPLEAANARARREMGNMTLAAEESAGIRGFPVIEQLLGDVRYGLRLLTREPAFSLVLILSLALGIAGTSAVFSTVNALLIEPLPFHDPGGLVRITSFYPKALLVYFQQRCRTVDVASVSPGVDVNVTREGPAFRITAAATSANLFAVLGAPVQIGRAFEPSEDQPGRDRVAILSHQLWVSRFRSDPTAIGRVIRVNEVDRRIVGVMPAEFVFPSSRVQLWYPARLDPGVLEDYWVGEFVPLIGRLRAGFTVEQAKAEIHSLAAGVWSMFPFPMPRHWNADATIVSLQADLAGDARSRVLILFCAVAAVLTIACVNAAGLLLARAITRRKELTLRAALGAGQGRIIRQLLTESVVIAAVAGLLGLALGAFALQTFRTVVPADIPGAARIRTDWTVAAFTAILSLLTGAAFGIVPALTASRMSLSEDGKSAGRRSANIAVIGFRNWLVGAEVALTLVLVVAAALLVRSLYALSNVDPGFQPLHVLAVKISPDPSFCSQPARCLAFYARLLEQTRGLPGVIDAAIVNTVPMDGSLAALPVDVEDHPRTADFPSPMFWTGAISPSYPRLMRIPFLAGRAFTTADSRDAAPVVIVTAATAERFWPGQNPLGKHVKAVFETRWRTVVGVVADVRQFNLNGRAPSSISGAWYMPYSQSIDGDRRLPAVMQIVARTVGLAPQAAAELHQLAAASNPNIPVGAVADLPQLVSGSVSNFRSAVWLFLGFAAAALFLAGIGIYGLVSYAVAQRACEIGIRLAIGATPAGIVSIILARSLRLALLGACVGLLAALVLTRGLSALLFQVAPSDPLLYAGVFAFLLCTAAVASFVPAWRAARADPIRTLRAE